MAYRASTGDLSFVDDGPRGGGERWDRDRFERMRGGPESRGGGRDRDSSAGGSRAGGSRAGGRTRAGSVAGSGRPEHDHFRFTEHERFPGGHRDIDIHADYDRPSRGPPVMERERFREDDRFSRPARRRQELFDEPTPSEVANQALAPYRRMSVIEKNVIHEAPPSRRPVRPGQMMRRQSSLDTYDRRPLPKFNDFEAPREEWRPPTNVAIPLPIRERRRSPPRRFQPPEDDFEEIKFREFERERESRGRAHEEYREVEIKREKSKRRRSRSRAARSIAATSVRSSSASSFEEVNVPIQEPVGRKGKTRMPKRLAKKQAIIELGYPFEEEDDFIIVRRALDKEHIDEIIKISENYKEPEKTTYVYAEETSVIEAAPPPPPPPMTELPPPPAEIIYQPPPPPSVHYQPPPPPSVHYQPVPPPSVHYQQAPPPPQSVHYAQSVAPPPPQSVHYAQSVRTVSPSRHGHEIYEERIEESNHIGGPMTVLVPGRPEEPPRPRREERREERHTEERRITRVERDSRSKRDIEEEIRALEAERQMLKYERDSDYELVEKRREPPRQVVRIEKDRKGRREPNPKLVAAMLSTLT